MRPSLLSTLAILLCLTALAIGLVAVPVGAQDQQASTTTNISQTIEVHIDSGGDAQFRVVTEIGAETEAERTAFEETATEFEQGQFEQRSLWTVARAVIDDVEAGTSREMRLDGPNRQSEYDNETNVGRLVLSFEWENFARDSGSQLSVGDAWTRDGQLWLRTLDENQTLELHKPDSYDVEDASPDSFRDQALVWEGPRGLTADDLTVTYARQDSSSFPILPFAIVLLAMVAAAGLLYFRRTTEDDDPDGAGATTTAETGPSGTPQADSPDAISDPSEEPTTTTGQGAAAAASNPSQAVDPDVDPELLSDEERVERLLHKNGGRMKQANIVTETGWSNAKVSQLLSEMDDEDRIDKLRLGRENLIALPEEDVTEIE